MKINLFLQAISKFLLGFVIIAGLLFISAGTFQFWNAWVFIVALFVPMFIAGIFLLVKNPELLKKRLNAKEKETEQRKIIALSGLMFISAFIVSGLNYRFSWIILPNLVVVISTGVFLFAYLLYAEVLRENIYLSRTVEVQENQKVIDSGLYGIVRHPMYMSTILLFLSIPLILGCIFSFFILASYLFIINKRIKNEEEVLEKNLQGYSEYKKRVKYKVIPFIW